jgi:iron complex outermembrane receptor protein
VGKWNCGLSAGDFQLQCFCVLLAAFMAAQSAAFAAPANEPAANPAAAADPALEDILKLDIDQLARAPVVVPSMDIPVTSVTKEQSTVGRSAAAVFVITNEMIRRSGATCIPEALRMAPGLEVARVNSNTWAITSRGFNNTYANKLLVLIDGRTVYSPVFSGVYWDVQDVVLEDVERIEVIRGPGGTLWGANAVNGVISIITKNAKDTQGAYINGAGGTVEKSSEIMRYGGRFNEDCYWRVYGKYFDRADFYNPTSPVDDAWHQGRFGFRSDWNLGGEGTDFLTLQGDHYVGKSGMSAGFTQLTEPYTVVRYGNAYNTGENVLARWRHVIDDDSDWMLQSYFDHFERDGILNSERVRTFDIDFQYRFPLAERHSIICGAGYRYIHDDCPSTDPFTLCNLPTERATFVGSQFAQDEISLAPDLLTLTLGCKLEQNSYTNFEYQPTIRLLWTPDRKHTGWAAVSRAVRTPSRVNENLFSTSAVSFEGMVHYIRLTGNPTIISEDMMAYELGFREQMTDRFSWDLAVYYNNYDHLIGSQYIDTPFPYLMSYFTMANGGTGQSYGAELAMNFTVSENWKLYAQYTYLHMHVSGNSYGIPGYNPHNQVYLCSSWNLRKDIDFDLMARYVDNLPTLEVPSYISLDARLAWRVRKHLELAVVGQNLLDTYHWEFGPTIENLYGQNNMVPRGVYGTLDWRY